MDNRILDESGTKSVPSGSTDAPAEVGLESSRFRIRLIARGSERFVGGALERMTFLVVIWVLAWVTFAVIALLIPWLKR